MEGPDNNVKINYTFEFPVTEKIKKAVPEYESIQIMGKEMNDKLGPKLQDFFRESNSAFEGKFIVTKASDKIVGMYNTEFMVKRSVEAKGLDYFRELLKEFTGTDSVKADVNLACFF